RGRGGRAAVRGRTGTAPGVLVRSPALLRGKVPPRPLGRQRLPVGLQGRPGRRPAADGAAEAAVAGRAEPAALGGALAAGQALRRTNFPGPSPRGCTRGPRPGTSLAWMTTEPSGS